MSDEWNIELDILASDRIPNWYEIVVADMPPKYWMQRYIKDEAEMSHSRLHSAQRIADACVEGTKEEMLAIAVGIREKRMVDFKRCAVDFEYDKAYFWSPRNSQYQGEVKYEVALRLAEKIEKL